MPTVRAEELTFTRLQSLDFAKTLCMQPVSALEVHGPHLPLGMDLFMARWMAEESGKRFAEAHPDWTVVFLPPLPVGTDELPLPGSMNVGASTFFRTLRDHARSLVRAGYRYIVVTNGHGGPRHAAAIEYVCWQTSRRYGVHMFSPSILALHRIITGQRFGVIEELLGRPLTATEREGLLSGEHAGGWETAFQLASNPDCVEPGWERLQCDVPPKWRPLAQLGERWTHWRTSRGKPAEKIREFTDGLASSIGWLLNAQYGYGGPPVSYKGAPSVASVELGKAFREVLVRDCLELIEAVVSGNRTAESVRSIASDHIAIQPLFFRRAALGALAALALLVLL